MVLVVRPLSGRTDQAADNAANERNQQGLEEERENDVRGIEAKGAHGGDFAATFGDCGVHGVEAPKIAPMAMMAATRPPSTVISVVMVVDCLA